MGYITSAWYVRRSGNSTDRDKSLDTATVLLWCQNDHMRICLMSTALPLSPGLCRIIPLRSYCVFVCFFVCFDDQGMGVDFTIEEKAGPKIPPMRTWEAVGPMRSI